MICYEILMGATAFNGYPNDLNPQVYSAPDAAALAAAGGSEPLAQMVVGLLQWDAHQRTSLDEAVRVLLSGHHCPGCAVLNHF
jgi:hypothetical protein